MQTGQIKKNEGNTLKCPIKEGKHADYHVQQGIRESTVDSSNTTDLTITVFFLSFVYLIIIFLTFFSIYGSPLINFGRL